MEHPSPSGKENDRLAHDAERLLSPLIAHDLRSALMDVVGGLELVDAQKLPREAVNQIERSRAAAHSLARMLETLLTDIEGLGRAGKSDQNPMNLATFLDGFEKRWKPKAQVKGLLFSLDAGANMPAFLGLDITTLDRILSNVVENAIKYTEKGLVRVSVGLAQNQDITFVVRDTGLGFSQEALDMLFEYGGKPGDNGSAGGGLGLHIAARLTRLLSGDVRVFNSANGAVVSLSFPKSRWLTTVANEDRPHKSLSAKRVLLAEDNKTSQILLQKLLTNLGAEVTLAHNGKQAIDLFEDEEFDLILLDMEMPILSGLDVISHVRADRSDKRQVPILAVSAVVLRDEKEKILRTGANKVLVKPVVDKAILATAIEETLLIAQQDYSTEDDLATLFSSTGLISYVVFKKLIRSVGAASFPELLTRVIEDLQSVQSELSRAVSDLDYEVVRSQTHILISVAGAMGAQSLLRCAQILNVFANEKAEPEVRENGKECQKELRRLLFELIAHQEQVGG